MPRKKGYIEKRLVEVVPSLSKSLKLLTAGFLSVLIAFFVTGLKLVILVVLVIRSLVGTDQD